MKIALLSDIHANHQALQACLAHAADQGSDQLVFLGDLVGYGAEPGKVLECIMDLALQGAVVIKGNHDEMAVDPPQSDETAQTLGNSTALWTHQQLSAQQISFLGALPMTHRMGEVFLVHASADAPQTWRYVEDVRSATLSLNAASSHAEIRYVFGGHVHFQSLYYRGAMGDLMKFAPTPGVAIPVPGHRCWVCTIGSVGQPRDGDPRAMYAVFDTVARKLTFHRVPYRHQEAAQAIREAGLPEYFAQRLERGQ